VLRSSCSKYDTRRVTLVANPVGVLRPALAFYILSSSQKPLCQYLWLVANPHSPLNWIAPQFIENGCCYSKIELKKRAKSALFEARLSCKGIIRSSLI